MNSNGSLRLVKLAVLALLSSGFGASLANAQVYAGKFTLPFEARWGRAVLPAGDYTFTMDSASAPFTIIVRGEQDTNIIMTTAGHDTSIARRSVLQVVRHGAGGTIRSLTLAELGVVLYYRAPKGEPAMFAQAPELIQRLPVSPAGK